MYQINITRKATIIIFALATILASITLLTLCTATLTVPTFATLTANAFLLVAASVGAWFQIQAHQLRFETNESFAFRRAGIISLTVKRAKYSKVEAMREMPKLIAMPVYVQNSIIEDLTRDIYAITESAKAFGLRVALNVLTLIG